MKKLAIILGPPTSANLSQQMPVSQLAQKAAQTVATDPGHVSQLFFGKGLVRRQALQNQFFIWAKLHILLSQRQDGPY